MLFPQGLGYLGFRSEVWSPADDAAANFSQIVCLSQPTPAFAQAHATLDSCNPKLVKMQNLILLASTRERGKPVYLPTRFFHFQAKWSAWHRTGCRSSAQSWGFVQPDPVPHQRSKHSGQTSNIVVKLSNHHHQSHKKRKKVNKLQRQQTNATRLQFNFNKWHVTCQESRIKSQQINAG